MNTITCVPRKLRLQPLIPNLLITLALCFIVGCSTLDHRGLQTRFEEAVRADNERFRIPFVDVESGYRSVASEITPAYVARLNPRLRPNALLLKAVSLWRSGEFAEASATALEGQAEVNRLKATVPHIESGRDNVILMMLPGLTEDARSRARFSEGGVRDIVEHYDEYVSRFRAAIRGLTEAREKVGAATPTEVVHYWNY
ncbi:MAG: hypothetical protein FJ405_18530, partial [Verrucomicrobia bacterium]|nr:hypothetical protein [Verrucomicrobiota bacterium]